MSRLTKIDKYGNIYTNTHVFCRNLVSEDGMNYRFIDYGTGLMAFDGLPITKLYKLENFEEEMNVPLDKVINALFKEGIYIFDAGDVIHLDVTEISLHYNGVQWLWETTHGIKPFRNYKYTWWFTKEEVEE